MSEAKVVLSVQDGVATVRFNRPGAKNALDGECMALLHEAFTAVSAVPGVRVVVLTGTGDTFSAGADLKSALAKDETGFAAAGPEAFAGLLTTISDCPRPVIARVQGNVFGGGNGLVAACDLAVADPGVTFAFSEVRLGLIPAVISVVCLAKLTPAAARELLLLGGRVPAQQVLEAGMINAVTGDYDQQIDRWVASLKKCGPNALAGTKDLIATVPGLSRADAYAYTAQRSGEFFASDEAREGMSALLEKRPPSWTV